MPSMKNYHPRTDNLGHSVELKAPSHATDVSSWADPKQPASITPGAAGPAALNGIVFADWEEAPTTTAGWEHLVARDPASFTEPPMVSALGKAAASGVVVVEVDGRVWTVSPSNAFGGYVNSFPKGKLDRGLSMRGNALKEGFEESGLQLVLTGFLCDSHRTTSVTRYYLAKRVGGHPASMSWESQSVNLIPSTQLAEFVTHKNDLVILHALQQALG